MSGNERRSRAPCDKTWLAMAAALCAAVGLTVTTAGAIPVAERGRPLPAAARPELGGALTYGVDTETPGNWCLPDARPTTDGTQVVQAIYETLVVPNAAGKFVPYLARSVAPSADFTDWTIKLREGIEFHDGTALDASAVAQNLDAYRMSEGFGVALSDITGVAAVDGMTVRVTTRVPWVAFAAFLWGNGRMGIVAPAQLSDRSNCARNLIGTGPFRLQELRPDERLVVRRNDRYWQQDRFGTALPYLDEITFRSVRDAAQRLNGLKGGDLDVIQLTNAQWMIEPLRADAAAGVIRVLESRRAPAVGQILLNDSALPFSLRTCRLAVAYSTNRRELSQLGDELGKPADQPFAPRTLGHQPAVGFPRSDPDRSQRYLDRCVQALGADRLRFSLSTTPDAETQVFADAVQAQMEAMNIQVDISDPVGADDHVERVVAGDYQATLWSIPPALDPDTLFSWWHSTTRAPATDQVVRNPLNLARFEDVVIDRALERARSEPNAADRAAAYQRIGREFAEQVYVVWTQYIEWVFAARPDVRGLGGPRLPNGNRRGPPPAGVQPVLGLWVGR